MKTKRCGNCNSRKLINLFSLGDLSFTGKFPKTKRINIKKTHIGLVMCSRCFLVQLSDKYNLKYLYSPDYGYRTGINATMRNHMKDIKENLCKKAKLSRGDNVLDIASNDGTLLNLYNKNIIKVGVDPLVNKYSKYYRKINYKISDFFSIKKIKNKINKKFKIITALSVFYDIENPNQFLKDIYNILQKDGIFMLEHADLLSILKFKMFDTICHEHIYYYSTKIIINIVKNNNLRVFDLKRNNINGGSVQYFICKNNSKYKTNHTIINKIINDEKKMKLETKKTWRELSLPTADFVEIRNAGTKEVETTPYLSGESDVTSLGKSFVVKPAREGSSFGISIVHPGKGSLEEAMKEAIKFDETLIVEAYIKGEEISVPIIGLIENMSYYKNGSKKEFIFGKDGVRNIAEDFAENFLGEIPLSNSICESSDVGRPFVLQEKTELKQIFNSIVDKVDKILKSNNFKSQKLQITNNKGCS